MVAAATSKDYPQWEYDFLSAIGAPKNKAQLDALNLWAASEGMPANTNNYLAITDPNGEFGAPGGNPPGALAPGVWNYVKGTKTPLVVTFNSRSDGINALVSFLQHGHQGIIKALRDDKATVESIRSAVAADGAWGGDAFARGSRTSTAQTGIYQGGAPKGTNAKKANLGKTTFYQCSSEPIIGGGIGPLKLNLLNSCQAKALAGGLVVGLGGIVFITGVFIISTAAVATLGLGSISGELRKNLTKSQNFVLGTNSKTTAPTVSNESKAKQAGYSSAERSFLRQQGKAQFQEDQYKRDKAWAEANPV